MDSRSLTQQVEETFRALGKTDSQTFVKSIQDLASKAGESTERTAILLFTLIVAFFLIDLGLAQRGKILILDLDDLAPLRILLPIVIAYTYVDLVTNISKVERLSKIYTVLVKTIYPSINTVDTDGLLHYFIFIPNLLEQKYSQNDFALALWKFSFYTILSSPVVFEFYAILRLLNIFTFRFTIVFGVLFSIAFTAIFSIQGIFRLLRFFRDILS